jgi:hypothetical protein
MGVSSVKEFKKIKNMAGDSGGKTQFSSAEMTLGRSTVLTV